MLSRFVIKIFGSSIPVVLTLQYHQENCCLVLSQQRCFFSLIPVATILAALLYCLVLSQQRLFLQYIMYWQLTILAVTVTCYSVATMIVSPTHDSILTSSGSTIVVSLFHNNVLRNYVIMLLVTTSVCATTWKIGNIPVFWHCFIFVTVRNFGIHFAFVVFWAFGLYVIMIQHFYFNYCRRSNLQIWRKKKKTPTAWQVKAHKFWLKLRGLSAV